MTQITLSIEQTRLLRASSTPIVIVDSGGRKVVEIDSVGSNAIDVQKMSDEEWIAEGLRRKQDYERNGGPTYTTAEVLEYLRSLKPE